MGRQYRFLDGYTADVAFEAYGDTIEEAFVAAAEALMEIQTDLKSIEPRECVDVHIEGFDMENLMKKWLEEMLYYRDTRGMFFSRFDIKIGKKEIGGESVLYLEGRICGEPFDPEKHASKVEVKAISYHDMEIGRRGSHFYARILVDI